MPGSFAPTTALQQGCRLDYSGIPPVRICATYDWSLLHLGGNPRAACHSLLDILIGGTIYQSTPTCEEIRPTGGFPNLSTERTRTAFTREGDFVAH